MNARFTGLLPVGTQIDLTNCDREPIHMPGSIQPRGFLIAVREADLRCTQVSDNAGALLGLPIGELAGCPLAEVIGVAAKSEIERAIAVFGGDLRERNPVEVELQIEGESVPVDAILHRAPGGLLVIELEPAVGPRPFSFSNTYLAVRGVVAELNRTADLRRLYEITVQAVQTLTGFDRVMIYRYDADFNGEVVAERKRAELEPFLGLHYPASDIPAQARALYEINWIRLISDVDYTPVPLTPPLDPLSGTPLDMTLSTLRSVSPIHVEYLHNMGVRASMSISLLRNGTLWGLIACHHYSGTHAPPYGVRAAAEFLGAALSLRLVDHADQADLRAQLQSAAVLAKVTAATVDEAHSVVGALLGAPSVLDLIPADGVAIAAEGTTVTRGVVPDPATIQAIVAWARTSGQDVVATDSLPTLAPELLAPALLASGVLAVPLPDDQFLVWFRAEKIQDIDWAGNPHAKVSADSNTDRLSPRKSFDQWRETVRLRSQPWTASQQSLATDLRRHVVETLYTRSQRGLRLAETFQRSLLPARLPSIPGWSLSAHYEIAERGQIGGDWYDAFFVSDHVLAVVLGDVAGHGIAAAGTMAQLRNVLRGHLFDTASPGAALTRLNRYTTQLVAGSYATAIAACIDTNTGHVRAASAGHPTPHQLDGAADLAPAPIVTSPPLGVRNTVFHEQHFTIARGGGLILYSDGVIERRGEDLDVSIATMTSNIRRIGKQPTATEIFDAVTSPNAFDDATVLALHRLT